MLGIGLALLAATAAAQSDSLGMSRLKVEMQEYGIAPCNSTLELYKFPLVGWHITCNRCGAIPADRFFPKAVLDAAEQLAVNRRVYLADLHAAAGQCG